MTYSFNPVNRMSGLASGLDTKTIVEDLMKAARIPLDRMLQNQQLLKWQQEDYRAINSTLADLQTNSIFPLKLQSSFLVKKAVSSDNTVVSAAAGTNAVSGSYTITSVNQLATAHSVASDVINPVFLSDTFTGSSNIDLANTTAYVDYANGKVTTSAAGTQTLMSVNKTGLNVSKFRFNANTYIPAGTSIAFYYSTDGGAWTAVNPGDEVTLGSAASQLKFKANLTGTADARPELLDYSFQDISRSFGGTFQINGKSITVAAGTTSLTAIRDLINSANAGVTAQVADDRLIITSTYTGTRNAIRFVDDASTHILTQLGILDNTGAIKNELQAARDAQLVYGGLTITRSSNTITDLIQGLTLELKKSSPSPVTINVNTDADTVVNTVKQFVEKYNAALDKINGKLNEQRYRDYPPLTEDQKKQMSADEIKNWEEKARSGLLQNDAILNSILYQLRDAVENPVAGVDRSADSLLDLGITFGQYWEGGKLYLDEAKLREAVSANPEGVMQLFTKAGSTEQEKGIAVRLYDAIQMGIDQLNDEAGRPGGYYYDNSFLSQSIRDMQERIDRESERLSKLEESYWQQFTTMEQYIAQMNSQSMWLAQQFSR